jgi:NTP pyrophosphatase (non-canonical NTP hydrolase)
MREEFDDIDYAVNSFLEVPDVPEHCVEAHLAAGIATQAVENLEEEMTFRWWLQISLDNCCQALLEETLELIEEAEDVTIPALMDAREWLWADLLSLKDLTAEELTDDYNDLVEDGAIDVGGRSGIFIQPSGDGCDPDDVYTE